MRNWDMPERPRTLSALEALDDIPRPVRFTAVAGWLLVVAVTYWVAYQQGWNLTPRLGTKAPLFMVVPSVLYWPIAGLLIWAWRRRSAR